MRVCPPTSLTKKLSLEHRREVTTWWTGLSAEERRALGRDRGRAPAGVVGRFVEPGEAGGPCVPEEAMPTGTDFYEHLVNHEIFLDDGPRYQICSAHPEARALLRAGRIPATFHCPLGAVSCPMREILDRAPGRELRLSLVDVTAHRHEGETL